MDKSPIKSGELCFLRDCFFPENNGRVVTTVDKMQLADGVHWICLAQTPLIGRELYADGSKGTSPHPTTEVAVREWQLIPIRDNDGETDELSKVRNLEHAE